MECWAYSASRPELTPRENAPRSDNLLHDIRLKGFGFLNVRGRYVENYGTVRARSIDEHGFLVFGSADDSGNLKGFLRKYGRKFDQDAVVHKGYYRDVHLHALKDLSDIGLTDGQCRSLDGFSTARISAYCTLLLRRGALFLPLGRLGPKDPDWLGGRWEDIGVWAPRSFFNRAEKEIVFENV